MPATQLVVEHEIKCEKLTAKIAETTKLVKALKQELNELGYRGYRSEEDAKAKVFIKSCPSGSCNGFLGNDWKCGICDVHVCKDCHEIVDVNNGANAHVCSKDALETVKLLTKNTKPCPKCSTAIFKIDGCDQMFCTQCQTAFSWNTMKIVQKERIHNPHYFEWLRNNAPNGEIRREPGDGDDDENALACDVEIVEAARLLSKMKVLALQGINREKINELWEIYRFVIHVDDHELHGTYRYTDLVNMRSNMDIRKKYIRSSITREKFQAEIQKRDKKRQKMNEFNLVLSTFARVGTENINKFYNLPKKDITNKTLEDLIENMSTLKDHINESCSVIGKRYGNVYPCINKGADRWTIVSKK